LVKKEKISLITSWWRRYSTKEESTENTQKKIHNKNQTREVTYKSAALPKGSCLVNTFKDTMTEGTVATWLKKVGDKIAKATS
jgi:pyruvate dehydrogenase E2 component (dihydrolipoamide acetyltransferase)